MCMADFVIRRVAPCPHHSICMGIQTALGGAVDMSNELKAAELKKLATVILSSAAAIDEADKLQADTLSEQVNKVADAFMPYFKKPKAPKAKALKKDGKPGEKTNLVIAINDTYSVFTQVCKEGKVDTSASNHFKLYLKDVLWQRALPQTSVPHKHDEGKTFNLKKCTSMKELHNHVGLCKAKHGHASAAVGNSNNGKGKGPDQNGNHGEAKNAGKVPSGAEVASTTDHAKLTAIFKAIMNHEEHRKVFDEVLAERGLMLVEVSEHNNMMAAIRAHEEAVIADC